MKGDATDGSDPAPCMREMVKGQQHHHVLTVGNTALNLFLVILMREHYRVQTIICSFHITDQSGPLDGDE